MKPVWPASQVGDDSVVKKAGGFVQKIENDCIQDLMNHAIHSSREGTQPMASTLFRVSTLQSALMNHLVMLPTAGSATHAIHIHSSWCEDRSQQILSLNSGSLLLWAKRAKAYVMSSTHTWVKLGLLYFISPPKNNNSNTQQYGNSAWGALRYLSWLLWN